MGKVTHIQKSRKEHRCNQCGNSIPVGSDYYKGEINFGPTIIRCNKCGLKSWEVTTSDYLLAVGPIVEEWGEHYSLDASGVEDMISELESIRDDVQERLDNMPESLQYGDVGSQLQDRIDGLESAISELEDIYIEDIQSDAVSDKSEEIAEVLGISEEYLSDMEYDEICEKLEVLDNDLLNEIVSSVESAISDAVQAAISNIEY